MDTIGLLAAWVGILSFLIAVALVVATSHLNSPLESRRGSKKWRSGVAGGFARTSAGKRDKIAVSNADILHMVFLFGTMIRDLVFGATVLVVSIQILDLGPALLAAALPFNINGKLITQCTGILLFLMALLFVFRLCYLAVKIRRPAAFGNVSDEPESTAEVSGVDSYRA